LEPIERTLLTTTVKTLTADFIAGCAARIALAGTSAQMLGGENFFQIGPLFAIWWPFKHRR